MTTNIDPNATGIQQAIFPPSAAVPTDEDIHMDNEQFEGQIRLNNLLQQQCNKAGLLLFRVKKRKSEI